MQAKYIFKYELVKHFTKADSYFTKMIFLGKICYNAI